MVIYVPEDSTYNKCYVVQNENVIRGYDRIPTNNTNYNYRDYYINSDYIYKDGNGNWSQYTNLPICLDSNVITNNNFYRLDIDKILIIFLILFIFIIKYPYRLFIRLFGRWLRL